MYRDNCVGKGERREEGLFQIIFLYNESFLASEEKEVQSKAFLAVNLIIRFCENYEHPPRKVFSNSNRATRALSFSGEESRCVKITIYIPSFLSLA